MDIRESMTRANALYAQGKYQEAATLANSLAVEPEAPFKEIFVLNAKCLIRMCPALKYVKSDTIAGALVSAAKDAETVEEVYDMLYDFNCAYEEWHREQLINTLAKNMVHPTLEGYQAYMQDNVKYLTTNMTIELVLKQSEPFKALLEKEGLTPKDATSQYQKSVENKITDDERAALEFQTGCDIFKSTQEKLTKGTTETPRDLLSALFAAEFFAGKSVTDKLQVGNDVKLARLNTTAEMIRYRMVATVRANGKEYYLYNDTEGSGLKDLNKIYDRIRELDPTFVAPPAPERKKLKSGCYVATAVYGSYDCPQVWTLRRFRDNTLANTWYGRAFIRTYYAVSPTLVKWFGQAKWFKNMWRPTLDRMVTKLNRDGVESTPYDDRAW